MQASDFVVSPRTAITAVAVSSIFGPPFLQPMRALMWAGSVTTMKCQGRMPLPEGASMPAAMILSRSPSDTDSSVWVQALRPLSMVSRRPIIHILSRRCGHFHDMAFLEARSLSVWSEGPPFILPGSIRCSFQEDCMSALLLLRRRQPVTAFRVSGQAPYRSLRSGTSSGTVPRLLQCSVCLLAFLPRPA